MDERTFQSTLSALIEEIERMPEQPSKKLKKVSTSKATQPVAPKDLAAAGKSLDEMSDYLRLQIKYLVFDLEATRRENSYLRKMLDSRPPHTDIDGGGHESF